MRKIIYTGALTLSVAILALQLGRTISLMRQGAELKRKEEAFLKTSSNSGRAPANISDRRWEKEISQTAKEARVPKLTSVGIDKNKTPIQIQLEWEGSQSSTLRFLRALENLNGLGTCLKLQLASSSDGSGAVRGRAVFSTQRIERPKIVVAAAPAVRDVFRSPWTPKRESLNTAFLETLKKQEESRKADQARLDEERKAQEETARLDNTRRQLETQYVVTGIVHNGREALAFVSARGGENLMLRSGDTLQDARVTAIDDKKGEVRLDYLGKFQTVLRLNSPSGRSY